MQQHSLTNNTQPNLIWVDLEMTGINPEKDHILEIAIVITDQNLNIIADHFEQIIHQPVEYLQGMNEVVKTMHTTNGLLTAVANSKLDLVTVENNALEFIMAYVGKNISPMCGNSICLDRRFLYKYMPKLEAYFHYRNLDVSTIKSLATYWYPEKFKLLQKASGVHRAKNDILESVAELKFYRESLFINN